jgi:hypothetical protein
MANIDDPITAEQVILKRFRCAVERQISTESYIHAKMDSLFDYVLGRMRIELERYVWGRSIEIKKVMYPQDWWEAFKEEFFPRWACKRWPVKFRCVSFDVREMYPSMTERLNSHDPVLHLVKLPPIEDLVLEEGGLGEDTPISKQAKTEEG